MLLYLLLTQVRYEPDDIARYRSHGNAHIVRIVREFSLANANGTAA